MKNPCNSSLIELHVPDFNLVKDFYGSLGFKVVWQREPDGFKGYLVMKRAENILCFWCGNEEVYDHSYFGQFSRDTKRGYGVEMVLMVHDIESFYNDVKEKVKVVEDLRKKPWGLKDFRVVDPFGYYLRFTENHNILDERYAVK